MDATAEVERPFRKDLVATLSAAIIEKFAIVALTFFGPLKRTQASGAPLVSRRWQAARPPFILDSGRNGSLFLRYSSEQMLW